MLGAGNPRLESNIYLIDFGLAGFYKEPNGTHISNNKREGFIGNPIFASIN